MSSAAESTPSSSASTLASTTNSTDTSASSAIIAACVTLASVAALAAGFFLMRVCQVRLQRWRRRDSLLRHIHQAHRRRLSAVLAAEPLVQQHNHQMLDLQLQDQHDPRHQSQSLQYYPYDHKDSKLASLGVSYVAAPLPTASISTNPAPSGVNPSNSSSPTSGVTVQQQTFDDNDDDNGFSRFPADHALASTLRASSKNIDTDDADTIKLSIRDRDSLAGADVDFV
ncbi:hypothetical protein HDU84_008221 [Entophlyctis sp. JEL0112]|nr:hypothetical protein HDU84_008221 [Entophlyctis sp. JEL0112]